MSSHLVLKIGEESCLSGSSKFINFVVINLVFSEIGSLVVTCSEVVTSGVGFFDHSSFNCSVVTVLEEGGAANELLSGGEVLLSRAELAARELASFSKDGGLSKDFSSHGVNKDLIDNWLLEDFSNDVLSFLDVGGEGILFSDDGNVLLLDQGGVLLVDNGLMVLMNVLFVDNGLVVLMDNVLVMFMNNVLLVFNKDVLVMLVDDVLMDFLYDGCIHDLLSDSALLGG